jgi:hypothetical protein
MENQQQPQQKPPHEHEETITVNGRPKKWDGPTISFEQLVQLAFPDAPPDPNRIYTVTFKRGHEQGSLVAGETVSVKGGMIFNVTATVKS